jgi:IclR family pca regulon transcriptional regulator
MSEAMSSDPTSDHVQSLARGLRILSLLGEAQEPLSVTEIVDHVGLNRATVWRLLKTLENLGYVGVKSRRYSLRARVLELGYNYLTQLGMSELVAGPLDDLSHKLAEPASISILDGDHIVYVARSRSSRIMTVSLGIGARLPVWNTSMGRVLMSSLEDTDIRTLLDQRGVLIPKTSRSIVGGDELLAELDAVRARGWALVDQELEWGLRSVAVPLRKTGRVVAAINVATSNVGESTQATVSRVLNPLLAAAKDVESLLSQVFDSHLP